VHVYCVVENAKTVELVASRLNHSNGLSFFSPSLYNLLETSFFKAGSSVDIYYLYNSMAAIDVADTSMLLGKEAPPLSIYRSTNQESRKSWSGKAPESDKQTAQRAYPDAVVAAAAIICLEYHYTVYRTAPRLTATHRNVSPIEPARWRHQKEGSTTTIAIRPPLSLSGCIGSTTRLLVLLPVLLLARRRAVVHLPASAAGRQLDGDRGLP
jgi:hypothetical protein